MQSNDDKNNDILRIIEVVDGIPQFSKKELECIPEFAAIRSRIRKCVGDADGRKKIMNNRELLYVKYMADFSILHSAFRGEERHNKARQDSGLPNNWVSDDVIEKAIKKHREIQLMYCPTVRLLCALEQGMMLSAESVEGQLDQMQVSMATSKRLSGMMKDVDKTKDAAEIMESMLKVSDLVQARIKDFMKMVADIPKALKQIKELQEQVMLEKSGQKLKRGGYSKGNREDPK